MGKTFKKKRTATNGKKRVKKNRFVSISFTLLWVVLFGICIYIYNISNTNNLHNKDKAIMASTDSNIEVSKKGIEKGVNTSEDSNKEIEDKSKPIDNSPKDINTDNNNENKDLSKKEDAENSTNKETIKENTETKENNTVVKKEDKSTDTSENTNMNNENKTEQDTQEKTTVSTNQDKPKIVKVKFNPDNKVVVIDPGHAKGSNLEKEPIAPGSSVMKIKDGGGATGQFTHTPEYVIAMEVSNKLKPLLEEKGFTVIMTKTDNNLSLGNIERAEIGNNANAALVIRVHADSAGEPSPHGASMLVPDSTQYTEAIYDESKRCGSIVLNTMVSEVGMNNRGIKYREDITGFNWSKVPVILVEMGFLSNEQEDKLLNTSEYQDKIAKGLADGIQKALTPQ